MPTRKEELTMKALEVCGNLWGQHQKSIINASECDIATRAVLDATGWGITKEAFLTLSERLELRDDGSDVERTYIPAVGRLIRVSFDRSALIVRVSKAMIVDKQLGEWVDTKLVIQYDTPTEAAEHYLKIVSIFTSGKHKAMK